MKTTFINIYPASHTWKQRWTVIWSTLLGKPYHLTISHHEVWKLIDRVNGNDPANNTQV